MLPFTQERLTTRGTNYKRDIFYYNLKSTIPEVYLFSRAIYDDLKIYLGIEFEVKQRLKFSQAVDDNGGMKEYDAGMITRIDSLYEFYIDCILRTTQLLYYEEFNELGFFNFSTKAITELSKLYKAALNDALGVQDETGYDAVMNKNEVADPTASDRFYMNFEINTKKSGIPLSKCFNMAIEKCQPIRTMVEQQINIEFPIKTLQDKIVSKDKIVVSKKKGKKQP